MLGIDISKWQGEVNFDSVKRQTDFIIIRSSYGTGFKDECFDRNCSEVRRLNIPHGFYHYSYPNHNEPEAEADWFLSVVGELQKGESLYLDFEENYPDPVGWSKRFLDRVSERLNGYKPLIYLNQYLTQTYDWSPVASANYGLWLAKWDFDPDGAFTVSYWDTVAMRQYSNNGSYNGIVGRVDQNVFYGEVDQFLAYGVQTGEIPCESIKEENAELKSENQSLKTANAGLVNSLSDLNSLYKKLLEDDVIEDELMKQLVKDYDELTKLYKAETDKNFELDKLNQTLAAENEKLIAENQRLKLQNFTCRESIGFILRCLKGGGKA